MVYRIFFLTALAGLVTAIFMTADAQSYETTRTTTTTTTTSSSSGWDTTTHPVVTPQQPMHVSGNGVFVFPPYEMDAEGNLHLRAQAPAAQKLDVHLLSPSGQFQSLPFTQLSNGQWEATVPASWLPRGERYDLVITSETDPLTRLQRGHGYWMSYVNDPAPGRLVSRMTDPVAIYGPVQPGPERSVNLRLQTEKPGHVAVWVDSRNGTHPVDLNPMDNNPGWWEAQVPITWFDPGETFAIHYSWRPADAEATDKTLAPFQETILFTAQDAEPAVPQTGANLTYQLPEAAATAERAALPDLIPRRDATTACGVMIRNQGQVASTPVRLRVMNEQIELIHPPKVVAYYTLEGLQPGQSSHTFQFPAEGGHSYHIEVDDANQLSEQNETNNRLIVTCPVAVR